MLNWPFEASATLLVQGWGFWLAIIGTVISIVGFGITISQLIRTKRATEAVSEEVRKIQFAFSRYNAVIETSRAETSLDAARKHIKANEWDQAEVALEVFSKSIHTLRELKVREIFVHDENLSKAMSHADRLCQRLEAARPKGLPINEITKALSTLRDHDRYVTSVKVALDRSAIGE